MVYVTHYLVHHLPAVRAIHWDHHEFVSAYGLDEWHWTNLLLLGQTWKSSLDMWIVDVVPTLIFCWLTGQWWIAGLYYVWGAFLQERWEHSQLNLPFLTTGKWHLKHHGDPTKNYGLFLPVWDWMFGTEAIA